jgi:Mannosylglycerate hydrolase MGH1-like glycoside hydrolase domain/Glycosyl hydrolase family 63 C-terminal domain
MNEEKNRLLLQKEELDKWRNWGPYLTERQWGTVREDYSSNGDAWHYSTHDHARSKAYRWGEEGIGGISDSKQILCFAPAFWNGKDPILKEILYGLNETDGNHGEDVKEYYYYLDNLPAHTYMKMLYKYPQNEFPYHELYGKNKNRGKENPEYELIDTGIFDNDEYFDIFIEFAKASPDDILIKISAYNRDKRKSQLNVIPQLWFRNSWSWGIKDYEPVINSARNFLVARHKELGTYYLYFENDPDQLFTDNNTNVKRLYNVDNAVGYFKDGIEDYVVSKKINSINKNKSGTKAALNYELSIAGKKSAEVKLRLTNSVNDSPFSDFDEIFEARIKEADEFYSELQAEIENKDEKEIQRQAFAGMLWNKQFYYYDVREWLNGDPAQPLPPEERKSGRNSDWFHLNNFNIISMPDKWEYPWYATWDLAFHCIPFAIIDPEFAKEQLILFTREWYMHPNGEFPAYEWNFTDVNPPVHAWASWRVYKIEEKYKGKSDIDFLERVFHKLLLNFTWWVNRKDRDDRNIFQGGFLGMDNIGIFNRSGSLPGNSHLDQSDATSWMAMYSLNMMRIALELSKYKSIYQDLATKFFEHFLYIANAMTNMGDEGIGLWDEEDEFYYDALHFSDSSSGGRQQEKLKVRSMVGLVPLFAVEVLDPEVKKYAPKFFERLNWFLEYRKDLAKLVSRWYEPGEGERSLLSLLRGHRMKLLLCRMLDETEFLSDFGIRSLSKYHEDNPYILHLDGKEFEVKYTPAESDDYIFGGNSNWRGPIWFPVNFLIIESLQKFHHYYGDDFKIEYPTNSGKYLTIKQIADELTLRMRKIFLKDKNGKRPVYGKNEKFQTDPYFKDYIPFYEYFNGDTGQGLGASHQTGWTGLIAKLLQPRHH